MVVGRQRIDPHRLGPRVLLRSVAGQDHFRVFQVDEAQPRPGRAPRPQGHQLRRVVAERVVRREPRRAEDLDPLLIPFGRLSMQAAPFVYKRRVQRHGAGAAFVHEEVDFRSERRGAFHEDRRGTVLADPAPDVGGASGRVVADREIGDAVGSQF